jgi:hypothetical protein
VQRDFELIVSNAKTYNNPSTIYYKEAHKLGQYGRSCIQREAKFISYSDDVKLEHEAFDEPLPVFSEEIEDSTQRVLRKRLAVKQSHHQEYLDSLQTKYNPDGTLKSSKLYC